MLITCRDAPVSISRWGAGVLMLIGWLIPASLGFAVADLIRQPDLKSADSGNVEEASGLFDARFTTGLALL